MTTNSQLSTTEPKKQKQIKQTPEEDHNPRNEDHMEGYQLGGGKGRMGEKVQGLQSIIGRYKIDRRILRIIQEMEKPKNLYA